jgi:hypothetical protein
MNPDVEARWFELCEAIERDLGDTKAVARVPTWPPTAVEVALEWARTSIYEGWYVSHLVDRNEAPTTLWMKVWEFGDDEPTWDAVKATLVAGSNPANDLW